VKFFDILSSNFNRLMGIPVGYFGSGAKSDKPGPGKARAIERLAAHRKAQAERLKDAPAPQETRQQRRAQDRQRAKTMTMTAAQRASLNFTGQFPEYPRTTFTY
jgi:hypothetical protein